MPDQIPKTGIEVPKQEPDTQAVGWWARVPLWAAIPFMLAVLVIAALILAQIGGPLYGLLFPGALPIPDGSEQVEHAKPDRGPEYWIYRTTKTGLEVARYYEEQGGTCSFTAQFGAENQPAPSGEHSVARCLGQSDNPAGGYSWEVYIADGYTGPEGPTRFRIYKYG